MKNPIERGLVRNGSRSVAFLPNNNQLQQEQEDLAEGGQYKNNNEDNSYNNDNNHGEDEEDDDDEMSDNTEDSLSSSDNSSHTIEHCPQPPANSTQDEINKFYWEWCYGPVVMTANVCGAGAGGAPPGGLGGVMGIGGSAGGGRRMSGINGGLGMRSAPAKSWYVLLFHFSQCAIIYEGKNYSYSDSKSIHTHNLALHYYYLVYPPRRNRPMLVPIDHPLILFHRVGFFIIHPKIITIVPLLLQMHTP